MEDFNALAAAVAAGLDDVRGCLILSRDGLVLGVHPAAGEVAAKSAWLRLAGIGEVERGFLQFGTEIWCYVRRGPYAAFALAGQGVRPGLVIDHMEQALLTAEEARSRREAMRGAEATGAATAPSGKPRSQLHREPRPDEEAFVIPSEAVVRAGSAPATSESATPVETAREEPPPPDLDPAPPEEPEEPKDDGVDRFRLAREFSQLLQDEGRGADG